MFIVLFSRTLVTKYLIELKKNFIIKNTFKMILED